MRTRMSIAGLIIVVALAIILWWASGGRPPHTRELSVIFTGFTNRGAGGLAAVFCVTNGTSDTLYFELLALEKHADGGWTPAKFDPDPRLDGIILCSQSVFRSVSVPSINADYRLRVAGVERRKGLPGIGDSFECVYDRFVTIKLLRRQGSTQRFLGRRYEVTSEDGAE